MSSNTKTVGRPEKYTRHHSFITSYSSRLKDSPSSGWLPLLPLSPNSVSKIWFARLRRSSGKLFSQSGQLLLYHPRGIIIANAANTPNQSLEQTIMPGWIRRTGCWFHTSCFVGPAVAQKRGRVSVTRRLLPRPASPKIQTIRPTPCFTSLTRLRMMRSSTSLPTISGVKALNAAHAAACRFTLQHPISVYWIFLALHFNAAQFLKLKERLYELVCVEGRSARYRARPFCSIRAARLIASPMAVYSMRKSDPNRADDNQAGIDAHSHVEIDPPLLFDLLR